MELFDMGLELASDGTSDTDRTVQGCSGKPPSGQDLDPEYWPDFRAQAHVMLDDMLGHLQTIREQPVWQPAPTEVRAKMNTALPVSGRDIAEVHRDFRDQILPFGSGNLHPGFMGWAQGGGTAVGMLAEMLAAGMNSNLGGRDHMPIEVERQIIRWMRTSFGFPETAGGLFLTGASQANFVALLIARRRACGPAVRNQGLGSQRKLTAYGSVALHGCVPRALDMAGIGSDQLRLIETDAHGRINPVLLAKRIRQDRANGDHPFLLIGTAGTVDIGAIDDLGELAAIARAEDLHFHVDGALGALGIFSHQLAPLLAGIEQADSLAFDFHKWGQVPYDAGFLLVRDQSWQTDTFRSDAAYLTRATSGLASGDWWPCDHGPDLSRGFRALKTWFTLQTYGTAALGASMAANCQLALELERKVLQAPDLELLAPVALNIVCFGHLGARQPDHHLLNARITERLQSAGHVAPSVTLINGHPAIRAAFVNHRTALAHVDALIEGVQSIGSELLQTVGTSS